MCAALLHVVISKLSRKLGLSNGATIVAMQPLFSVVYLNFCRCHCYNACVSQHYLFSSVLLTATRQLALHQPNAALNTLIPNPVWQVLFSRHSGLAGNYTRGVRLLALAAPLSMMVNFMVTPFFLIVPVVSVVWGVFPVDINRWFAIAVTVYYPVLTLLKYYGTSLRHVRGFKGEGGVRWCLVDVRGYRLPRRLGMRWPVSTCA